MSLPLATVTTEFLDRPDLASSTVRSYELALLPLLKDYGSWPIELVDRSCLEAYLNSLTHLAYTTHRRHQTTVQALFNFAVERDYIRSNPIARLKHRKPDARDALSLNKMWLGEGEPMQVDPTISADSIEQRIENTLGD